MYSVKIQQNGVIFDPNYETFDTKKEAVKYAREFRNSFIRKSSPLRKENSYTFEGQPIFKAVHPAFGCESYAKVKKI